MINKRGPNIEPCGTPVDKLFKEDLILFISTYCCLFDNYLFIRSKAHP